MKKPIFGDCFRFPETDLDIVAIYTHRNAMMGDLIHIYCSELDIYRTPSCGRPMLSCFFPLNAALKRGIVTLIDRLPVPPHLSEFPLFRSASIHPKTGERGQWWLWDGNREWRAPTSFDVSHLPDRAIFTDLAIYKKMRRICAEPQEHKQI